MGEVVRLLRTYGYATDRRMLRREMTDSGDEVGLLRVHRVSPSGRVRKNWHWCVLADGDVFDPAASAPMDASIFFDDTTDCKIYFYPVTRCER